MPEEMPLKTYIVSYDYKWRDRMYSGEQQVEAECPEDAIQAVRRMDDIPEGLQDVRVVLVSPYNGVVGDYDENTPGLATRRRYDQRREAGSEARYKGKSAKARRGGRGVATIAGESIAKGLFSYDTQKENRGNAYGLRSEKSNNGSSDGRGKRKGQSKNFTDIDQEGRYDDAW